MEIPVERSIQSILPAFKINMGGVILDQALPQRGLDQVDPFLLLHHWRENFSAGTDQREVGVPPHPHRGFAPVTFIFEGALHHRDSTKVSSIVKAGGTQWMHSGTGIVHSERPSGDLLKDGGVMEIIQFWVNVPAKHKMTEPFYHPVAYGDTPKIKSDDGLAEISLVAGELGGKTGPVPTHSPMLALRFEFKAGAKLDFPVSSAFNTFFYQLDGALEINGKSTKAKDMTVFANDGDLIRIEAKRDTRAMLLAGEPIAEPLATYGPFVMNSQEEIMQAMQDYQAGKMGTLVETFD